MQECACQAKLTKGRMCSHSNRHSLAHTLSLSLSHAFIVRAWGNVLTLLYLARGAAMPWGCLSFHLRFRLAS